MRIVFILCVLFISSYALQGQDSRLAAQYYNSGEYAKAATVYKKLYDKQPNSTYYFDQYIKALIAEDDHEMAERAIQSELKRKPDNIQLYVTYGNLLERQLKPDEAEKKYRQAIAELPANGSIINNLGNSFTRLTKYELAIETYKKGEQLLGSDKLFINNLAELYRKKGDTGKLIEYYIKAAVAYGQNVETYKTKFQTSLTTDDQVVMLKEQLYAKIQEEPENKVYPELLEWVFIRQEDYPSALRQARALDRRLDEDGTRVLRLANIALNSTDYNTAIRGYNYVIEKKGKESPHYVTAHAALFKTKRKQILASSENNSSGLDSLSQDYAAFIEEMGINSRSDYLVKEYADFLALYKNDLPAAIVVLENLVELGSINKYVRANSKIALADYYLMGGEIWDATLLYSQVEKDFKEEHLGEVSRFKNAMLAYYAGEFGWAQEQFDILESATSRLISNDAIDMSVFIMDNMGLDTTDIPLKMFADAELLTVQNKYDEAFSKLDEINKAFPEHALLDDILYQQAELYYQKNDFVRANELFQQVYETYPEEIRADNALYRSAMLHENELGDQAKAMVLYEKLFVDFSNSTFAIDARKQFRSLRGDDI